MVIEIVCPLHNDAVKGEIISSGVMEKKVWEAQEGLSGEQTKKWKTILVRCFFCGERHEYALTMNPK